MYKKEILSSINTLKSKKTDDKVISKAYIC